MCRTTSPTWHLAVSLSVGMLMLVAGCSSKPATPPQQASAAARRYIEALSKGDATTVARMTVVASKKELAIGMPYDKSRGPLLQQVQALAFRGYQPSMIAIDGVGQPTWLRVDGGTTYAPSTVDEFFFVDVDARWTGKPATALPIHVSGVMHPDGSMQIGSVQLGAF